MNLNKILNVINKYHSNYVIYRFVDIHNYVIYVGRTYDLYGRMKYHKELKIEENYYDVERIEFIEVVSYAESRSLEAYFIAKYKPKYNKIGINAIFTENKDLDNLVWKLYAYYPRKEICKENKSLYDCSTDRIIIEFNLASIWLMINYCNVSLENCSYIRIGANKIDERIEKEINNTMYNIYNSLSRKIIYKVNKKYKYIKVSDIYIKDYPKTIEIMFREKFLIVNLEIYDIYGFYLDTVPTLVSIKDIP